MKKIVCNEELQIKMSEAINLLCDTVKVTLGPRGNNVIIDHSTFSPFITNDGVTIAENIESEDPVINTILELAKEASIKTNENVGDGTTTTLVLLQSIFNNGLEFVKSNKINSIILKRELSNALDKVIREIKKKAMIVDENKIIDLVSISANDNEIGKIINEAYKKIENTNGIKIYEGNDVDTKINYLKGYTFETNIASPYYFLNNKDIRLNNAKILLVDNYVNNIEDIANILNQIIIENKNLVIVAKDYSEEFINDIINLNMELDINIYLLKSIMYGKEEKYFYDDLKDITNSVIINDTNNIDLNSMGNIKNITINKEYTNIEFEITENILKKIEDLQSIEEDSDFLFKRISMLNKGIVNIVVGAPTITERREKKMRYDDALCALKSIKDGILPGSGLTLLEISNNLENRNIADAILKESLKEPFNTIMTNAGLDKEIIKDKIINNNYKIIYNVNKDKYEDIVNTEVIDSVRVVINCLTNAVSIASMLLTTSSLVINEYQNNLQKENNYNEL